jgi:hypothetical protein
MRVIFDRSAFHGERFGVLRDSPLQRLVNAKRVTVIHTPIFLEETITTFGKEGANGEWPEHLAFALDICNGGFFEEAVDIWHAELVCGRGRQARFLLRERRNRHGSREELVARLRRAVADGDLRREWIETQPARDESYRKKQNQRQSANAIRAKVSQALKSWPPPDHRLTEVNFEVSKRSEFISVGRHLMRLVDPARQPVLGDQWERNPTQYPFYSAFVEGLVYSLHYAAIEHNKRIDDNAQADFEQLAYLTWADMFVLNDTRFLRDCFDAIWRPRGKRLESAESFADLMRRIV